MAADGFRRQLPELQQVIRGGRVADACSLAPKAATLASFDADAASLTLSPGARASVHPLLCTPAAATPRPGTSSRLADLLQGSGFSWPETIHHDLQS